MNEKVHLNIHLSIILIKLVLFVNKESKIDGLSQNCWCKTKKTGSCLTAEPGFSTG